MIKRPSIRAGRAFPLLVIIGLTCCAVFHVSDAAAALTPHGILDQVDQAFTLAASQWRSQIIPKAKWLFMTLAMMGLVWKGVQLALQKGDLGDFFAVFIRWGLATGFFWWLLVNGPAITGSFTESMLRLGASARRRVVRG